MSIRLTQNGWIMKPLDVIILTLFGFTENMKWIMNTAELKRLVFAYWKVYKAVTQHNARQCTPCPLKKQLLNRPECGMRFWLIHWAHSFPFQDSMPKSVWVKRTELSLRIRTTWLCNSLLRNKFCNSSENDDKKTHFIDIFASHFEWKSSHLQHKKILSIRSDSLWRFTFCRFQK